MAWDPCHAARLQSKCLCNTPRTSPDVTTPSCPNGSEPTRLSPALFLRRLAQTLRTASLLDTRPLQTAPPSHPRGILPLSPLPCPALSGCHPSLVVTVDSWQVRCTSLASWWSAHPQSLSGPPPPNSLGSEGQAPGVRQCPFLPGSSSDPPSPRGAPSLITWPGNLLPDVYLPAATNPGPPWPPPLL